MRRLAPLCIPVLVFTAVAGILVTRDWTVEGAGGQPPGTIAAPTANDPVARLNELLDSGRRSLAFRSPRGYLDDVLEALDVPAASQSLVFSRTSRQRDLIGPKTPRALYFNDTVSVGWMPGGDVLEIATSHPTEGVAFYTLDQRQGSPPPRFARGEKCSQCHLLPDSGGTLGLLMMSVLPRSSGDRTQPVRGWPVDQRTPVAERWGGWYVTGGRVPGRHLGNVPVEGAAPMRHLRRTAPALDTLAGLFDTTPYRTPQSDVVALLVLTHQVHVTNAIVRVGREMQTLHGADLSPRARVLIDELVEALIFADDVGLPSPVSGHGEFARWFETQGPRDQRGRTLRTLDLTNRLFRYPLSYMIDGAAFVNLPPAATSTVYARIEARLNAVQDHPSDSVWDASNREAALDIFRQTRTGSRGLSTQAGP